jgi:DNA-binding Lrp family transcriptional regulator
VKRITVYVETNKLGSRTETVIDVDDDDDTWTIEDQARDEMFNMIFWDWYEDE